MPYNKNLKQAKRAKKNGLARNAKGGRPKTGGPLPPKRPKTGGPLPPSNRPKTGGPLPPARKRKRR